MPLPRGNRVSFLAPSGAMLVVKRALETHRTLFTDHERFISEDGIQMMQEGMLALFPPHLLDGCIDSSVKSKSPRQDWRATRPEDFCPATSRMRLSHISLTPMM